MVRPERFELPTYSSGGCRSIQLSYGRMPLVYIGTGDLLFQRSEPKATSRELRAENQEPPISVRGRRGLHDRRRVLRHRRLHPGDLLWVALHSR
jgi:hypothetical protein